MTITWAQYLTMVQTAGGESLAAAMDRRLDIADENCPRDTETLVKSRTRTEPEIEGSVVRVIGGYGLTDDQNPKTGESSSEYAVKVHEDTRMTHPRGGNAKWLENAMTGNMADLRQEIVNGIGSRM